MKWFMVSSQLGGWFTKSFHWADASCLIWVEKSGSRFRFLGVFKSRLSFVSSSTPRQVSKIGCGTARKKNRPPGRKLEKWPSNERQGRSKFPLEKRFQNFPAFCLELGFPSEIFVSLPRHWGLTKEVSGKWGGKLSWMPWHGTRSFRLFLMRKPSPVPIGRSL